jgi:hypothetical protein
MLYLQRLSGSEGKGLGMDAKKDWDKMAVIEKLVRK